MRYADAGFCLHERLLKMHTTWLTALFTPYPKSFFLLGKSGSERDKTRRQPLYHGAAGNNLRALVSPASA